MNTTGHLSTFTNLIIFILMTHNPKNLTAHLKQLKTITAVLEPYQDLKPGQQKKYQKKVEPIIKQFSKSLLGKNRLPRINSTGVFSKLSFCFPQIDQYNDPDELDVSTLTIAILQQGGSVLNLKSKTKEQVVNYILIDPRTDIQYVQRQLKGRVIYTSILNFNFIKDSLRKFKRMEIGPYNLQQNIQVKDKKEEEEDETHKRIIVHYDGEQDMIKKKIKIDQEIEEADKLKKSDDEESDGYDSESEETQKIEETEKIEEVGERSSGKEVGERSPGKEVGERSAGKEKGLKEKQEWLDGKEILLNTSEQFKDSKESQGESQYSSNQEERTVPFDQSISKQDKYSESDQDSRENRKDCQVRLGSHQFVKNHFICEQLMKMQKFYTAEGDNRKFAYLKAISLIKNHAQELNSADDLKYVDGITKNMIEKIKGILATGHYQQYEQKRFKETNLACKQFLRVYGIGPHKAEEFYKKGIKTIKELEARPQLLNKHQKIGLKYLTEFQLRIPREKISRMLVFLKETFNELVQEQKSHLFEIAGSYRRNKENCGDIDVLITRKDGKIERDLLMDFVELLEKKRFITDHCTTPKTFDGRSSVNYMGVCQFEDQSHHRIDIKHYPVDQYAFALLYFTGSHFFNREMRVIASAKGLQLSDHGVKAKNRNYKSDQWKGTVPKCYSEEDIFDLLKMEFKKPEERDI